MAENQPRFATLVQSLAISVRSLAGTQRDADFVAIFVDGVDSRFRAPLEQIGIKVEIAPRLPGGNPLANKLRMLELHERHSFDVLAGLDCDTIVVGDPTPWIETGRVGLKPADYDRLREDEWRRLFAAAGLTMPARELKATATGAPLPPYFNSGVMFVPAGMCGPLRGGWTDTYNLLLERVRADPSLLREQWRWLVEQLSLGFAVLREGLPWYPLPSGLNFPTHVSVIRESVTTDPVILHYHGDHDEQGFVYRSVTPAMDPFLDKFNRARAANTGLPYGGIRRLPLVTRVRRRATRSFWGMLADRKWYRSPVMTRMRARVKR